jgi:prolipoprotein diacylglyceryltransferase
MIRYFPTLFYKKKKYDGQIFLLYITWYGFGRMFIEGLRTVSLMIGNTIRVSQMLALLSVIFGLIMLVICGSRINKHPASVNEETGDTAIKTTADVTDNKTENEEKENNKNQR